MKRITYCQLFLFSLAALVGRAGDQGHAIPTNAIVATPAFIAKLADELQTNSPALHAAAARVDSARAGVRAVRRWEDPEATFGVLAAEAMRRKDDGDLLVGVEQKLPLFGKPAANLHVAEAALATQTADADSRFQLLRLELAKQVFRVALADHFASASHEDRALAESGLKIAESRLQSGVGSQSEVLRLQNELASRREDVRAQAASRDQERRTLNRLMGREIDSPWPRFDLPDPAPEIPFTGRVRDLVLKNEARLKVMRHETGQARAEAERTRRQRRPDIAVGIEGRQFSGEPVPLEAMVTVRVSLPWFNGDKYRRDIERDEARVRATEMDVADYERFAVTEAARVLTEATNARRRALLHRDEILPRARRALEASTLNWANGQGMLLDVTEARRMLIESRRTYAEAVAMQYQALAELALCCGVGELEALQMLAPIPVNSTNSPALP
ncbi:MAG: TolC family protein [Verrucomicrobia bacterium]|nr:TolC family protein [Verrucomicrobiota bacterium]